MVREEGESAATPAAVADEERLAQSGPVARPLVRLLEGRRHRLHELLAGLDLLELPALVVAHEDVGRRW